MDGSMPWAITKLTGATLIATGVVISPFAYISYQNAQALQNRIESLDTRPTHVFKTIAGCTAKGYSEAECGASMEEAFSIAGNLGTTLKYDTASECFAVHSSCQEVVTPITTYTKVGDVSVPITTYYTNYHPPVIGWQAAKDNLNEAVPLYQSAAAGMAVRIDGAQFSMR